MVKNQPKELLQGLYHGSLPTNTLVLAAHCDDIAFGLSGLAKLLNLVGSKLTSIILTDQGNCREQEELRANEILGIEKTYFLKFEDGKLHNELYQEAKNKILEIMKNSNFDNIISFDNFGYTGHLDHVFASLLAGGLFEESPDVDYLSYQSMSDQERNLWKPYFVHIPNQSFFETMPLHIESVIQNKIAAIQAHESQYQCDGQAHINRILNNPQERYRILTK